MNKEAIRKTAICYWSDEDDSYVVESPLFETIAGVGKTEKASRKIFEHLLDDAYEAYLEGRVAGYEKPGRPAKGRLSLNIDVKPNTKEFIKKLADNIQCSQGEIIDFLAWTYQKQQESQAFSYTNISHDNDQWLSVCEKLDELKDSIYKFETEIPKTHSTNKKSLLDKTTENIRSRKQSSSKKK